ncbi:MAG TPA: hypothetical protein DCE41_31825 [Cytophagales bacterium]|nr:hypothetical protein [Cytophagales bacterium]HAP61987.1 hypothetical protein [Cytophagales bacterium]
MARNPLSKVWGGGEENCFKAKALELSPDAASWLPFSQARRLFRDVVTGQEARDRKATAIKLRAL